MSFREKTIARVVSRAHAAMHVMTKFTQEKVDDLARKAEERKPFTSIEKEEATALYWAFVEGGWIKGYHEASILLTHYLRKDTVSPVLIDFDMYESEPKVQFEMQKVRIADCDVIRKGATNMIRTSASITARKMNYADNRFTLKSITRRLDAQHCETTWEVRSYYRFEDFKGADSKKSHFHAYDQTLIVPDGLSRYLVDQGIAKEFPYYSVKRESWLCGNGDSRRSAR